MIEQISVPLSSQISSGQEQPSQEEYEPSLETNKVVVATDTTEETEEIVESEESEESEEIKETKETETKDTEVDKEPVLSPTVEETSLLEELNIKNTSNEQQEEKGVNNKETEIENNNSVTEDNIEEPINIEAAQIEISNILNNNNTTITENTEDIIDCSKKTLSPLLTYVVEDSLLPISIPTSNMPLKQLEYDVIHATGWDDNYPPHQLLPKDKNSLNEGEIQHGKGWQSSRQCTYPQEIILQVSCGVARIRKLQILSHHYKIAANLEIYVGSVQRRKEMVGMANSSQDEKKTLSWDKLPKIIDNDGINPEEEESEENDYDIIRTNGEPYILFRRLGYCALDNNERANYKARELKCVRLDTECEYIRLVARRCHMNNLNQYNQVGLVGIAVMGEPADYLLAGESQKIPIEHADEGLSRVASPETCIVPFVQDNCWMINTPNDQRNFTSLYSILPNSSLSANSDSATTTPLPNNTNNDQTNKNNNPVTANDFLSNGEETEKLLAAFGRAKQAAVKVEDFHLAKVLKYCTELVKKASEEVRKCEKLKRQAVEEEDFDNAEKYKHEIEAIRAEIRGILSDEGLDLDESGEVIISDPSLQDIVGLADEAENATIENYQQSSNPNVTGVPSGNEHQFQQDHLFATSAYIPKSRTNSNASIDRSGARAPEPMMFPKSRTSSDASVNRYLGGNYTYEQQEPTTPNYSTTPLPWTPFVDDRPSPALSNFPKADAMLVHPQDDDDEPGTLSDLARSAFALSIPFFGNKVIACLLSKTFKFRESAITEVTKRIDIIDGDGSNVDNIDKLLLVKATYQVMVEVLDDNRENLALQVLSLWEKLIKFCVHHQIPNSSTWKLIDSNYESLLSKIADSNDSIKQSSVDLFILLAKTYRTPTQSVLSLVLKPAKTSSQPLKKAKPTVELIIRLVEIFGVVVISKGKGKFDKDNKLSLDTVMEVSISYLNNHHCDVRDSAAKLVVEVIKRMGKEEVEPYLAEIDPLIVENIWNLVTEWEEESGKLAGELRNKLTEEEKAAIKNYELDEKLLQQPLAKRGTVGRIEQQLMEVRYMMNTTNHIIKDDIDNYIANATKTPFQQDEIDEAALEAEEAQLEAELREAELEEEQLRQAELAEQAANRSQTPSGQRGKVAAASKKTPAARGSKPAAPSKTASSKKSKDDGKAAPAKKTSVTKSAAASSKSAAAKSVSRRGSADDVKSTSKVGRKNSVNSTQSKTVTEPEKLTDEPDEMKSDRCIFCDVRDERFTEESLVTHYWNDCPVLTNCRLCNIILEISTLDDHMLNDCDKSKFVKQCPRCQEVIEADDFLEHMAKQSCMAIRPDIVRCPLCKTVVKPATEQGWKSHLLDENGCTKNRRKSRPQTTTSMVKEMEAAATAEKRDKKSASATKSSTTSKTPARKPTAVSKDKPKKASTTKVLKAKK